MNLLTPPAPSAVALTGFVTLVAAVAGTIAVSALVASRAAGEESAAVRRSVVVAVSLAAWLGVTLALAASGVLGAFERTPPPLMLLVGGATVLSTVIAFSRFGALLATALPTALLVGFHVFRLPLELILYQLSLDGVLPVQMTFDGMNYDVATGILAAVVGIWASFREPPRVVLMLWNLLGFFLLLTIMTIAIVSMPVPFRVFMNEPANTIVATAPFVWLPTFLVQAAWIGHLLMFRRLARPRP